MYKMKVIMGKSGTGKTHGLNRLVNQDEGPVIVVSLKKDINQENKVFLPSLEALEKELKKMKNIEDVSLYIDESLVLLEEHKGDFILPQNLKKIIVTANWDPYNPNDALEILSKGFGIKKEDIRLQESIKRQKSVKNIFNLRAIRQENDKERTEFLLDEVLFRTNGSKQIFIISKESQDVLAKNIVGAYGNCFLLHSFDSFKALLNTNSFENLDEAILIIENIEDINKLVIGELCDTFEEVIVTFRASRDKLKESFHEKHTIPNRIKIDYK